MIVARAAQAATGYTPPVTAPAPPSTSSRLLGALLVFVGATTSLYAGLKLAGTLWRRSAPNATWTEALLVNAALMALFALQHSGMARDVVQRVLLRHMPPHVERPLYAAASGVAFLALAWLWRRPPGVLWDVHGVPGAVLRGISLTAAGLVVVSLVQTGAGRLVGLTALRQAGQPPDETPPVLQTGGLYALVRHPLLVFTLALFWIWPYMTAGRALFAAGFTLYVLWAVPREERSLRAVFGADYDAYAARVSRWLPGIKPRP